MKRRTVYIWAILGGIFALSAVNRAINPHAGVIASAERHATAAKTPEANATPAAKREDPALEEARHQFREYCIDAVRAKLQFPATFKGHYFLAGAPWQVTWPADHTTSWNWTFNFEASNAYGAVGRYKAMCGQDLEGRVTANISFAE
jgi:hypothetical protein